MFWKIMKPAAAITILALAILFSVTAYSSEKMMKESNVDGNMNKMLNEIKKTVVFLGEINGAVTKLVFLKIKDLDESKSEEVFNELIEKGYLDVDGKILHKFWPHKNEFTLRLSKKFAKYEKEIIDILTQEVRLRFYATGFLVSIQNVYHLLTAKHVVASMKTGKLQDEGMLVFFNSKDGRIGLRSIESVKKNYGVNWIFHKNVEVDVAIIPFGLDSQKDDVKVIRNKWFLLSDRIFELYDVFFLSYQPGIEPQRKISPVIRAGIISIINDDKSFYIDASAFPGNSGSPVFLKPSPIRFDKNRISLGKDPLGGKFVGIIGEYIPYQEIAISTQTGRPRVIFEENTGLSKVWSVEFIKEILDSDVFKEQIDKIPRK